MGHQFSNDSLGAELAHDGGHALIAIGIAWTLERFGVQTLGALLVGAVAFPILWEVFKDRIWTRKRGWSLDGLHDIVTYQPAWVIYLASIGYWFPAVLTTVLIIFFVWIFYRSEGLT